MIIRLAIVEDDEAVRITHEAFFLSAIHDIIVTTYKNGQDLIDALKKGEWFHGVLMDGKLPDGVTGPEYTHMIKEIYPETIIIGYSSDISLKDSFLDKGADAFFLKITSIKELYDLADKIEGVLRK